MHIDIAKGYEINHWTKFKEKPYDYRSGVMRSLFDYPNAVVVADIGCGPRCGFFFHPELRYERMYAVDPLWAEYKTSNLDVPIEGVVPISEYAESFLLPEQADFIVSFNALDHSGSLELSILNIMNNIKNGGYFFFHVHMRTKEQLNKGHNMIITESHLDSIFKSYTVISKRIMPICPLDNKPYASYLTQIQK